MIFELLVILGFLISGSFLVKFLGFNGWYVPFLGYIVGVSIYVALGFAQVLIGIHTHPLIALTTLTVLTLALFIYDYRNEKLIRFSKIHSLIVLAIASSLVSFLWSAHLFNWHIDSFFNMEIGSLLVNNHYDTASMARVAKRLLAIPFIHASAHIGEGSEYYLRSFTPLLSLSIIASIAWIALEGLRKKVNKHMLYASIIAGLIFLITINRYVFHTFYINGHLFFAALLLIIAGFSWLVSMNNTWQKKSNALMIVLLLAIPALVVTRPEASMVAALALVPLLLNTKIPWKKRALPAFVLGVSMIAWQGYVSTVDYQSSGAVSAESYGLLVAGVALIFAIPLLKIKLTERTQRNLIWTAEGGLLASLMFLTFLNPVVLRNALSATYQNVVFGSWGWSLLFLGFVGILAIILLKFPRQAHLRFPLTTFIILGFLLAYLRTGDILESTGGYRVGNGDSFNRMLMQIVPLAVLYIIVVVASGTARYRLKKSRSFLRYKIVRI